MARYHVLLESRPTPTQESELVKVMYNAPDYRESWVGARTVCRLGTLFRDDPGCKNPANAREFYDLKTGEAFRVSPSYYTVRHIFAENSRKTGKPRMTSITSQQLVDVMKAQGVAVSKKLEHTLSTIIDPAGGVRVTAATAKRLGVEEGEQPMQDVAVGDQ